MALKKSITKAEYEKLSDEMKKAYKAGEFSDTFIVDTGDSDDDDPEELRRALAREREDRKRAQKELKALKEKGNADDGDADDGDDTEGDPEPKRGRPRSNSRQAEDAAKIDRDWKKRFDKTTGELNAALSAKDQFIKDQMIQSAADKIANKISTSPKLLAKAIADRLAVDFDGDRPELQILGDDGKPSGMSLDKLEKEFVANKEYSAIIIGSKASGGGAPKTSPETKPGGGAPASETKTDLSKMIGKDLAATLKARKEAAQQT